MWFRFGNREDQKTYIKLGAIRKCVDQTYTSKKSETGILIGKFGNFLFCFGDGGVNHGKQTFF